MQIRNTMYNNPTKTILFIGHSAGLTGAPMSLLRLIQWIKANTDYQIKIILKEDGPLRQQYENLGPTYIFTSIKINKNGIFYSSTKKQHHLKNKLKQIFPINSIDLIFTNTITNGEVIDILSYLRCPVICRVAELNYWIKRAGDKNLEQMIKHTNHYIAVSEAVKTNLTENFNIPESAIGVIYGFIPDELTPSDQNIRAHLALKDNATIVGGSGFEIWRKGKDLFIQIASIVLKKAPTLPIHFIWIGGNEASIDHYELLHDINTLEISSHIKIIGDVPNPIDYFNIFDIFTMTSREDPYPIVNLELAALGKPIICFDHSGGSPEFVESDAGYIVPYMDLDAMADKIIFLAQNKQTRTALGQNAALKVRERHNIDNSALKIYNLINRYIQAEKTAY